MTEKLPILVVAFNRADHVARAMEAIRAYQPERLYLECDGARSGKAGEAEAVEQTRKAMLDAVDWPCEVKTLFRKENLGCAYAVSGAISWFFEQEEWGVIIEDDVVVSQDFFKLCEELLPRYKGMERVMEISAQNHYPNSSQRSTYVYTNDFHCWGWATWARAWKRMDMDMLHFAQWNRWRLIRTFDIFRGLMMHHYWKVVYRAPRKSTSWATRWFFAIIHHGGLVIEPGDNLAINIGMDGGAHYSRYDKDPYAHLRIGSLKWPLCYDDHAVLNVERLRISNRDFKRIRWMGVVKKMRRLLHIKA